MDPLDALDRQQSLRRDDVAAEHVVVLAGVARGQVRSMTEENAATRTPWGGLTIAHDVTRELPRPKPWPIRGKGQLVSCEPSVSAACGGGNIASPRTDRASVAFRGELNRRGVDERCNCSYTLRNIRPGIEGRNVPLIRGIS